MHPDIRHRVDQAKIFLMTRNNGKGTVFFSALLSGLKIITDDCKTAWTDGLTIAFGVDFVKKCDTEELLGVMMHELGHVMFEHVEIGGINSLDPRIHNIACDHYINLWLLKMGFKLPHFINFYADPIFTDMSSMEIYNIIIQDPPPPDPNGMGDDIRQAPGGMPDSVRKEKIQGNMLKAVLQAEMANDYGSIPGEIARKIEKVRSPELPWAHILANHLTARDRSDYSWARPNRRYMPDFYLPALYGESMADMLCAKDVSGSISQNLLGQCDAEEKYFWDILNPVSLRSITFDTKIRSNNLYQKGDELPTSNLNGGGGTNVVPVFEFVRKDQPELVIIFTDGHFKMPNLAGITADIFWIIKGKKNFKAPMGTIIHM